MDLAGPRQYRLLAELLVQSLAAFIGVQTALVLVCLAPPLRFPRRVTEDRPVPASLA